MAYSATTGQQQLLEAGPGRGLQATPLLDRHQHAGFGAASGDHLRALPQAGIQQLTEARLGVLHGPDEHDALNSDEFADWFISCRASPYDDVS